MIRLPPRRRGGAPASGPKPRTEIIVQPEPAAILAALPDPVILVDRGGCIRFVNPAAEQVLGSGAAALRGSALADFLAPHSPLLSLVNSVWRVGNTISEYDVLVEGPRFASRSRSFA